MDLTKRVDDVTIEFIQDAGSTPAWSICGWGYYLNSNDHLV